MDPADQQLVVETIQRHAESLLRVARRYSYCADDAEDAYQRAVEIFVRNVGRLDPANAHKWLHTVVKHESLAVRRQRTQLVGEDEDALDALDARHEASVEERAERYEELARAAEALRRLKPQEVTALVLKAQGLSYREIAERQAWTYTKVNRCLTEGRRSFLERMAGIEAGAECERWAPVLAALADGEATAAQVADVRPHLRNCAACRGLLAGMHRPDRAAATLLPAALVGAAEPGAGLLARAWEALAGGVSDRAAASAAKLQLAVEGASGAKVAAVAATAAAVAGGGVAAERGVSQEPARAQAPPAVVRAAPPPRSEPAAPPIRAAAKPARSRPEVSRRSAPSEPPAAPPPREAAAAPEFEPIDAPAPAVSRPPRPEPEAPADDATFSFEQR